jgi:uncharacterized protein YegP (UPF0339 family)
MAILLVGRKERQVSDDPGYFDLGSFKDGGGQRHWVWRLVTASGATMAVTAPFDSQKAAEDAISWVRENASTCPTKARASRRRNRRNPGEPL